MFDIGSFGCGVAAVFAVEFLMLAVLMWREYENRKNNK